MINARLDCILVDALARFPLQATPSANMVQRDYLHFGDSRQSRREGQARPPICRSHGRIGRVASIRAHVVVIDSSSSSTGVAEPDTRLPSPAQRTPRPAAEWSLRAHPCARRLTQSNAVTPGGQLEPVRKSFPAPQDSRVSIRRERRPVLDVNPGGNRRLALRA